MGGGAGGAGASPSLELLLPSSPLHVTASGGDGTATVSFNPPKTDGGNKVTHYTVHSYPRGLVAKGTKSPITVNGLTNGKSYTFTVTASNSVGTGLESEPSNCVIPGQ